MRGVVIILLLFILIGCDPGLNNVTRFPTYSYYLENGKTSDIRLIGTSIDSTDNTSDTLIDTTISPEARIFLMSGLRLRVPKEPIMEFKSNGIEKCDSVYVLENDRQINTYANHNLVTSADINDSIYLLFQFSNFDVYAPFDTTEFSSEGSEEDGIKFKFVFK